MSATMCSQAEVLAVRVVPDEGGEIGCHLSEEAHFQVDFGTGGVQAQTQAAQSGAGDLRGGAGDAEQRVAVEQAQGILNQGALGVQGSVVRAVGDQFLAVLHVDVVARQVHGVAVGELGEGSGAEALPQFRRQHAKAAHTIQF
ncbi:hypothetical protein WKI71_14340 [Streptomyces sp. MS1.AVA.1]|uniref:Uncharacterized protein n=1 Tax=Streptomyces machairae TaxID=3134109 RepID=A0ABU8UJX1_9ACTN